MMRWLLALVVAAAVVCSLLPFHSRAMRRAWMWNARISLSNAYRDFVATGNVPSQTLNGNVHAYTNVVTIGGSNYSCAIASDESAFGGTGFLAITTNGVCVWFGRSLSPKIIGDDYVPPLFSPRF